MSRRTAGEVYLLAKTSKATIKNSGENAKDVVER